MVLHGAIFFATCVAMALREKFKVGCSVLHSLFATCILRLQRVTLMSSATCSGCLFQRCETIDDYAKNGGPWEV